MSRLVKVHDKFVFLHCLQCGGFISGVIGIAGIQCLGCGESFKNAVSNDATQHNDAGQQTPKEFVWN